MLLVLPDDDPRRKRVENRDWATQYTGDLLIHSGKSRTWLKGDNYGLAESEMVFGAIVGVCWVEGCAKITPQFEGMDFTKRIWPNVLDAVAKAKWPWLEFDEHAHGKYGIVTSRNARFPQPILYRGAQGFFDVPRQVVAAQLEAVGW
jgi:Hydroxymethylpyrimidine/phosphomethylpyrimidine kinase